MTAAATRALAGACDCHVHVFDPDPFPYAADRSYTPGPARVAALAQLHARLGVERTVLVQPSVYGTDNACLLAALRALGPRRARGIAVVDLERVQRADLLQLHAAGVRGLRLNLEVRGEADPAAARALIARASRVASLPGWHLQVFARAELLVAVGGELAAFPAPVVLDHFGGLRQPQRQLALAQGLLALVRSESIYMKASAPYKLAAGTQGGFAAAAALARAFHDAAPARLLWGSDWPHTGGGAGRGDPSAVEPFRAIDDATALAELGAALPGEPALRQLLVGNPARLYGFTDNG